MDFSKLFPNLKKTTEKDLKDKDKSLSVGDHVSVVKNIRCKQAGKSGVITKINPEDKYGWKSFVVKFDDSKYGSMAFQSGNLNKIVKTAQAYDKKKWPDYDDYQKKRHDKAVELVRKLVEDHYSKQHTWGLKLDNNRFANHNDLGTELREPILRHAIIRGGDKILKQRRGVCHDLAAARLKMLGDNNIDAHRLFINYGDDVDQDSILGHSMIYFSGDDGKLHIASPSMQDRPRKNFGSFDDLHDAVIQYIAALKDSKKLNDNEFVEIYDTTDVPFKDIEKWKDYKKKALKGKLLFRQKAADYTTTKRNFKGLIKLAENSRAFEILRDTFSHKNGFRLDMNPQNEFNYQYAGWNVSYKDILEQARKNGFGYHDPRVNDYGQRYGVDAAAEILDELDTENARNILREKGFPEDFVENYVLHENRDRASNMFDRQGWVQTIPQSLGEALRANILHRRKTGRSVPYTDMDSIATIRVDSGSGFGVPKDKQHGESIPNGTSTLDKEVLGALNATINYGDIYDKTVPFMVGKLSNHGIMDRKDQRKVSKATGVRLGFHSVRPGDRSFYAPKRRRVHLESESAASSVFHEFGHGKADKLGTSQKGYNNFDTKFNPLNLWKHPTILEEHGNADTIYGAGVGGDLAGRWYYANMLRNWYANKLHEQFGTKPVSYKDPDDAARHSKNVPDPVPGQTPRFLGR